ncbi:MAG: LbtU family siderophore porin [Thermodesulfobacteriota bacterium]
MTRTTCSLATALLILMGLVGPAMAESSEGESLRQREEKLEATEKEPEGFTLAAGNKTLTISGLLEVEATYLDPSGGPAESDLNVATAQLNFDAAVADRIKGRVALLHEEGEEPTVDIDEAYVAYSQPEILDGSLNVTGGKVYLPFGAFSSTMVSDPLTLELGESNRTALLAGWENGMVTLQAGGFAGDYDTTDHEEIDSGVVGVTVSPTDTIKFGVSYLSDLAETNAELLGAASSDYDSSVDAASAFVTLDFSPLTVSLEYLGALTGFSEEMLADVDRAADLTGSRPSAWFAEMGFAPHEDWLFTCRFEQASDYQDDVVRYGATVSYGLYEFTTLSLEYLYSDPDLAENITSQVTAQLALEF